MNRAFRAARRYALVAAVTAVLAGCSTAVTGTPIRVVDAPAPGGGTPSTGPGGLPVPVVPTGLNPAPPTGPATPQVFPSMPADPGTPDSAVGLKPGVPPANLKVDGDANSESDILAKNTIADVTEFLTELFPGEFNTPFVPPANYASYDSNDQSAEVCGWSLYQEVNASYAFPPCDTVLWDRGVLLPDLTKTIGPLAVPNVLAHEMGHRVQRLLGFDDNTNTVLVAEQQADCYAGAYWRWVEEGHSTYFVFNQGAGITQTLSSLLAVRDSPGTDPNTQDDTGQGAHGDAFDRAYAYTLGFANGAKRCSTIDQQEVNSRVSESPFSQIPDPRTAGNLSITDDVLRDIAETVNGYFTQTSPGYQPPTLAPGAPACQGSTVTSPAGYCPATNTVYYDLSELQRIGTPTAGFQSFNGDFSAIITVVSRYALAAQAAGQAPVTGDIAGLRGLCYAGTWASWMRQPQGSKRLALSPADLDKAVYQLINSPMPGSDVNGAVGTTIFDRLQAFNIGVTNPINVCAQYYSG